MANENEIEKRDDKRFVGVTVAGLILSGESTTCSCTTTDADERSYSLPTHRQIQQ